MYNKICIKNYDSQLKNKLILENKKNFKRLGTGILFCDTQKKRIMMNGKTIEELWVQVEQIVWKYTNSGKVQSYMELEWQSGFRDGRSTVDNIQFDTAI